MLIRMDYDGQLRNWNGFRCGIPHSNKSPIHSAPGQLISKWQPVTFRGSGSRGRSDLFAELFIAIRLRNRASMERSDLIKRLPRPSHLLLLGFLSDCFSHLNARINETNASPMNMLMSQIGSTNSWKVKTAPNSRTFKASNQ